MSRQKIKGEKPSMPRLYLPLGVLDSSSRKKNGYDDIQTRIDSIRSKISLTNQSRSGMPANESDANKLKQSINSFFKNRVMGGKCAYDEKFPRMIPSTFAEPSASHYRSNVTSNPVKIPVLPTSGCNSISQLPSSNIGRGSPRDANSSPSLHEQECKITSLSVASDFCHSNISNNNSTNDETLFLNPLNDEIDFPSPDPIAPDHPLSNPILEQPRSDKDSISITDFNHTISNTIDVLTNFDSVEQDDFSLFAGRNFFTLGEHLDRRSSLGA